MADIINDIAKEKILTPFRTLTKSKIIETGAIELNPSIDWESNTHDLQWSVSNGIAKSESKIYNIAGGVDPNALYLKSELGELQVTTGTGTTNIRKIEDLILGNVGDGKRGRGGTYDFIVSITSQHFGTTTVDYGTYSGPFHLNVDDDIYAFLLANFSQYIGDFPIFSVKVDDNNLGTTIFFLIRTKDYPGFDKLYKRHASNKYELVKEIKEDMTFVSNSTIQTSYEQRIVVI